ncbi:unnamed protein product [Adineta steineri]|uniref:Uncharacterized protein n=1 Tax=Adineta steineri TaxID=433720 RepID=A0A819BYY1_9BILA|nr:unnamed protein product [Adineta steineri]
MVCSCSKYEKIQRSNLRFYYGQPEGCGDWPIAIFCTPCALCQEARELNIRNAEAKAVIQHQPRKQAY